MTEAQCRAVDKGGFLFGRIPGGTTYWPKQRPKIFIRPTNQQAATIARAANMAADSVELGDIFSTPADVIVSPANSVGHMNGGVDLRIRDRQSAGNIDRTVKHPTCCNDSLEVEETPRPLLKGLRPRFGSLGTAFFLRRAERELIAKHRGRPRLWRPRH